jgi:hypothetical protein
MDLSSARAQSKGVLPGSCSRPRRGNVLIRTDEAGPGKPRKFSLADIAYVPPDGLAIIPGRCKRPRSPPRAACPSQSEAQ